MTAHINAESYTFWTAKVLILQPVFVRNASHSGPSCQEGKDKAWVSRPYTLESTKEKNNKLNVTLNLKYPLVVYKHYVSVSSQIVSECVISAVKSLFSQLWWLCQNAHLSWSLHVRTRLTPGVEVREQRSWRTSPCIPSTESSVLHTPAPWK